MNRPQVNLGFGQPWRLILEIPESKRGEKRRTRRGKVRGGGGRGEVGRGRERGTGLRNKKKLMESERPWLTMG